MPTPIRPEAIDSSMLSTYAQCPRQFYYRYILGLEPKGKEKISLDYGGIWHKAQENLKLHGPEAAFDYLEEQSLPLDLRKNRTIERMRADLVDYMLQYPLTDTTIIGVEVPFDITLPGLPFRYVGRFDDVRVSQGREYLLDHKTSTWKHSFYWNDKQMSFQMKGYVWAYQKLNPSTKANTILLDLYHILKDKSVFERRPFTYSPELLEEWEMNVQYWFEEIAYLCDNHLHEPQKWKLNWNSCGDYGGCDFFQVDSIKPANRMRELEIAFEESRWDPITHEES